MGSKKETVIVELDEEKLEQVKDVIREADRDNIPLNLTYISKKCDLDARSITYAVAILFYRGEIYTPNRNKIELTP
ncbi:hypothetical protein ACFQGE_10175 [Halomicroarcula sp. GCM10025817]|uniref:hypothetical protein n=1 Tax=Haloarcula TaxID=2237 RepID=UPI0023E75D43|nr:hypothetical protein [Halomicroarcula sp. SYNS111]